MKQTHFINHAEFSMPACFLPLTSNWVRKHLLSWVWTSWNPVLPQLSLSASCSCLAVTVQQPPNPPKLFTCFTVPALCSLPSSLLSKPKSPLWWISLCLSISRKKKMKLRNNYLPKHPFFPQQTICFLPKFLLVLSLNLPFWSGHQFVLFPTNGPQQKICRSWMEGFSSLGLSALEFVCKHLNSSPLTRWQGQSWGNPRPQAHSNLFWLPVRSSQRP